MGTYRFKYRMANRDYDYDSIINPLHLFIEQYLQLEQRNQYFKNKDLSKPRFNYKESSVLTRIKTKQQMILI